MVFFSIICIPTAGKMIDLFNVPLSITIYYFPFIYIFSDILTEVYGYSAARRVLWYNCAAQVLATLVFEFVVYYPPSAAMNDNAAYITVLSAAPRLVLFGILAIFSGDIVNNYIVAKMKIWTEGRFISVRFVLSTLGAQLVNTSVFYMFGLWGLIPRIALMQSIAIACLLKVTVEIVLLPITIKVARWLKTSENIDFYDRNTDFNPLKF
jgi:uncharacterized integral membrane protein (TIGR00697 family)